MTRRTRPNRHVTAAAREFLVASASVDRALVDAARGHGGDGSALDAAWIRYEHRLDELRRVVNIEARA